MVARKAGAWKRVRETLGVLSKGKKIKSFRANGGCGRESTSGLEWQLRDPHCHLPATLGGSLPFSKIKALPSSSGDNVGPETLKGRISDAGRVCLEEGGFNIKLTARSRPKVQFTRGLFVRPATSDWTTFLGSIHHHEKLSPHIWR